MYSFPLLDAFWAQEWRSKTFKTRSVPNFDFFRQRISGCPVGCPTFFVREKEPKEGHTLKLGWHHPQIAGFSFKMTSPDKLPVIKSPNSAKDEATSPVSKQTPGKAAGIAPTVPTKPASNPSPKPAGRTLTDPKADVAVPISDVVSTVFIHLFGQHLW